MSSAGLGCSCGAGKLAVCGTARSCRLLGKSQAARPIMPPRPNSMRMPAISSGLKPMSRSSRLAGGSGPSGPSTTGARSQAKLAAATERVAAAIRARRLLILGTPPVQAPGDGGGCHEDEAGEVDVTGAACGAAGSTVHQERMTAATMSSRATAARPRRERRRVGESRAKKGIRLCITLIAAMTQAAGPRRGAMYQGVCVARSFCQTIRICMKSR